MKEELTAKMHAEFQVSDEEELKLSVWSLLNEATRRGINPEELYSHYGLTREQVKRHARSYLGLFK